MRFKTKNTILMTVCVFLCIASFLLLEIFYPDMPGCSFLLSALCGVSLYGMVDFLVLSCQPELDVKSPREVDK